MDFCDNINENELLIPNNFRAIINEFTQDIINSFPEYTNELNIWLDKNVSDDKIKELFLYITKIYPERFFDILYQNEDIFLEDNNINTNFIIEFDFKKIYNKETSENNKKAIWKYLQLILVSILSSVKDKNKFGDCMNLFEGINEEELHNKLTETIDNIESFFTNINTKENNENNTEENNEPDFIFKENPQKIHEHVKELFEGKIGCLAKELAEEITKDLPDLFDNPENMTSMKDVLNQIIKNPKKITDLMKNISNKLDTKMKNGDFTQNEIIEEAANIIHKMKDLGGDIDFKNILNTFTKNKNSKFDMNAFNNIHKKMSLKEKLKLKLERKKNKNI